MHFTEHIQGAACVLSQSPRLHVLSAFLLRDEVQVCTSEKLAVARHHSVMQQNRFLSCQSSLVC